MFKTTVVSIVSLLVFSGACLPSDQDAEVRVDLEINDVPAPALIYVGPKAGARGFREALVAQLEGEQSVVDSPVSFIVRGGDDTIGGFVGLPDEGRYDLGPALDAIANQHGFALLDGADDQVQGDDGYTTEENGLFMICHSDACKELRCQMGVISPQSCDKPLCANAAADFFNATPQSCNFPGYANPCLLQVCTPIGCYCAWYR